jgi:hypothetical protein
MKRGGVMLCQSDSRVLSGGVSFVCGDGMNESITSHSFSIIIIINM